MVGREYLDNFLPFFLQMKSSTVNRQLYTVNC